MGNNKDKENKRDKRDDIDEDKDDNGSSRGKKKKANFIKPSNIGRGLSLTAGLTLGYLINKVQKERLPTDVLGYTIKTSALFFMGQYANSKDEEVLLRTLMGYWAYETMRLTPIGKPPKKQIAINQTNASSSNNSSGGDTTTNSNNGQVNGLGSIPTYTTNSNDNSLAPKSFVSSMLTPDNLQNVGVALKGLSSLINGFRGNDD